MKNKQKTPNKQRGFALMDVLIASLILAVGIVAFVSLQTMGVQRAQQSKKRLQSIALINNVVEIMRSNPYMIPVLMPNKNSRGIDLVTRGDRYKDAGYYTCLLGKNNIAVNNDTSGGKKAWCAPDNPDLLEQQVESIRTMLDQAFSDIPGQGIPGLATLCLYRSDDYGDRPVPVRLFLVWKNAARHANRALDIRLFNSATPDNECPENFTAGLRESRDLIDVTTPDRGFVDVMTSI